MTPEQKARDMLDSMGVDGAQSMTAGDLVELANMLADVAELHKDAERYRWLRQDEGAADWHDAGVIELYAGPDYSRLGGTVLDQAIDAAMAKEPKP